MSQRWMLLGGVLLAAWSSFALAQDSASASLYETAQTAPTVAALGVLGTGGSLQAEIASSYRGSSGETRQVDGDLELALGGGAQLDVPVHRHFSLGALLSVLSSMDDSTESVTLIDVLATPRLRFPFPMGRELMGNVFVQVPVGLSIVSLPDPGHDNVTTEYSSGPAFAVGLCAGFAVMLSQHVGVTIDSGVMIRTYGAAADVSSAPSGAHVGRDELDILIFQPRIHAGVLISP